MYFSSQHLKDIYYQQDLSPLKFTLIIGLKLCLLDFWQEFICSRPFLHYSFWVKIMLLSHGHERSTPYIKGSMYPLYFYLSCPLGPVCLFFFHSLKHNHLADIYCITPLVMIQGYQFVAFIILAWDAGSSCIWNFLCLWNLLHSST